MKNILQVKNLSHSYDREFTLKDISFSLQKGDFFGIIGKNGSGKSTLIRLILRLISLQKGVISINGTQINKFTDWSKVSFVSQKANSFNSGFPVTVAEIVNCGLISQKGLSKQEKEKKIVHSLMKVGLLDQMQKNIGQLSGGQQQRAFIARALVSDPFLIFLDEPTVGVDEENILLFWDLLATLQKDKVTIVMITHDIEVLVKYATKILVLQNKVDFFGDINEFVKIRSHKLHDIYGCIREDIR